MLWLDPRDVQFLGSPLVGVDSIAADRKADRLIVEFSDSGPHVVFADVPEQRVTLRITRRTGPGGSGAFIPGDMGALGFRVAPSAGDANGRAIEAEVVITAVSNRSDPKLGASQVIECVAVSSDGATDPLAETAG